MPYVRRWAGDPLAMDILATSRPDGCRTKLGCQLIDEFRCREALVNVGHGNMTCTGYGTVAVRPGNKGRHGRLKCSVP